MALVTVENLSVDFRTRRGTLRALDQLSLNIEPGKILGVVGESGAGKSLTGMAIMGLIKPPGYISGGRIIFEGQEIQSLAKNAARSLRGKHIAAIFQDPSATLNPLMTVGEQLIETIRTHLPLSQSEAHQRAVRWLDDVGIPAAKRRIDSYPFEFSGGMRQRVVIALALCAEPKLVIADEPTTALDASVQAQILDLLRKIVRDKGTSIMLITHDMGVIAETADQVAVIYAGRLAEIGSARAVIKNAQHPYTQGLIASIPDLHERRERLHQIDGAMPRLNAMPEGCRFAPRCPQVMPRCRNSLPELYNAMQTQASCFLYEDATACRNRTDETL